MSVAKRKSLLMLGVEEGARLIALDHLEAALQARKRLDDPDDSEALHDLRVALRRLRSIVRAYQPYLEDSVSRRLRKRLRELAAATTTARDAEVQLAWLTEQAGRLSAGHRVGLEWLLAWIDRRRTTAYASVRSEVMEEFERFHGALARRLAVYKREMQVGEAHQARAFAAVTAELLHEHTRALKELLGGVNGPDDEETAHEARIAAKRLRYLLEPLRKHAPGAGPAVGALKELQDVLGDLHDCAVLAADIGRALAEAVGEGLHTEAAEGMVAISRIVREHRDERFEKLQTQWIQGGDAAWSEPICRLASELDVLETTRKFERRFLLHSLPPLPADAPVAVIVEGWIGKPPLEERLRLIRRGGELALYRKVKVATLAVEQPLDAREFCALWPLTAGRRLRIRSRPVDVGNTRWELVELQGLALAVAHVADSEAITPPPWLQPFLDREVSDDPAFDPRTLAARRPGLRS
jgi:CHAD domain-containing protein